MATSFEKEYSAEKFGEYLDRIAPVLKDHLAKQQARDDRTLPYIKPDLQLENWLDVFGEAELEDLVQRLTDASQHIQNPRYVGHQTAAVLPLAATTDMMTSMLNNSSAVYEMSPAGVAIERRLVRWMSSRLGWGSEADGIFTSGGSMGNLTALIAARHHASQGRVWREGGSDFTVLVADQTHYSIDRAVRILGWGERGIKLIQTDSEFRISRDALEKAYDEATNEGRNVIGVVANACSTATGAFDPLEEIADFCLQRKLWFHVDAAHGGPTALSNTYRHLLDGIERADSVVWDGHKMMMVPSMTTAVLFRDGSKGRSIFSQSASYVFGSENDDASEWFNLGRRTIECTKRCNVFTLYVALATLGEEFFADFIDRMYGLTREFAQLIKESDDFEIAAEPRSNILCFRLKGLSSSEQAQLRARVIEDGTFYITQSKLRGEDYLRVTLINPLTTIQDLQDLLEHIRSLA